MKFTPNNILTGILIVVIGYLVMQNVSMGKAFNELNNELNDQKELNQKKFEEFDEAIHYRDEHLADLSKSYNDLEDLYHKLKSKRYDEKNPIRNITDIDSMRNEVARYYRR